MGIRTPGHILIAGLSAARDVSQRVRLGLDVNGAEIHAAGKTDKQLQLTAGGNYALTSNDTLDFGVFAGWFNSPRVGVLLGAILFGIGVHGLCTLRRACDRPKLGGLSDNRPHGRP